MAVTDRSKGNKGISAFIVERGMKGFSIGKNELKMGMHGCTTVPLAFTDCEVPAENLLGSEGVGYVQALKTLTMGRVTIASGRRSGPSRTSASGRSRSSVPRRRRALARTE